ncbi:unnamed protein product [Phyllotreta striolata]|uniref:DUF243 domain-containing protein n=1 Tax=Phyllotreta striolata TaxID=444603 RepID=A0A9N9TJG2_PHYSR|nr:unnamed protein product [Phyllotreta striolata]
MYLILTIAAALSSLASARPQYNYPPPTPQIPGTNYGTPAGGGGSIATNEITGGSSISGAGISTGSGAISTGGGAISTGGGGVLVQKHIYVHVAPPEPEEARPQRPQAAAQSTKHYKIIFIKAPSAAAPTAQQIALAAQNQEKTIVYVLVKRPEEAAEVVAPTAAPAAPSKPEVYFIRYKAKSEAIGGGATGGGIIGGGNIGGGSTGGIISTGSSGSSSTLVSGGGGRPAAQYGPPGQSGPY